METNNQFHVLTDRIRPVSAYGDHGLFAEDAERAGDDQHGVHGRPA